MPVTINIPDSNNTNTTPNISTPAPMANNPAPQITSHQSFQAQSQPQTSQQAPQSMSNGNNNSFANPSNGNNGMGGNNNFGSNSNGSSNNNPDAWWNSSNSIIDESHGGSGSNKRLSPQERVELIEKLFQEVLGRKADTRDINYYKYSTLSEEEMRKQLITGKEHKQLVLDGREFSKMRDRAVQAETRVKILEGQIRDQVQEFQHLTELLDEKNKHIQELRVKLNNPYNLIDHSKDSVVNADQYRDSNLNNNHVNKASVGNESSTTGSNFVTNSNTANEGSEANNAIVQPFQSTPTNNFQAPTPALETKQINKTVKSSKSFVQFLSNKLKEILP